MKIRKISGVQHLVNHWSIGFLCLVAVVGGICWYRITLNRVSVQVDGEKLEWQTSKSTVGQALREKGIAIGPGDEVTPAVTAPVSEGLIVQVKRAFVVRVTVSGQPKLVRTTNGLVKEILDRAGVRLEKEDRVTPELWRVVSPRQEIRVVRRAIEIVKEKVAIKPGVEYQSDPALEEGSRQVVRQGQEGIVERRIKRVYEDGKVTRQYKLAERVIKPAVNTVIALGKPLEVTHLPQNNTLVTTRGSYRYIEARTMVATAYSPGPESCGIYAAVGRTYTGKKAGFGLVAVDPRVIRLGTMLYVEGYGKAEAADIGSAIKGNRIDLCFETYREAVLFGKKKVKVYVLE